MRLSIVILSIYRWQGQRREVWQRAEELGFHAAHTYDHLCGEQLPAGCIKSVGRTVSLRY